MLGGLWLIGTFGSERIEPPLREAVSQFEVWRGLDLSRGPLDENFEDTSPKSSKDKKDDKQDDDEGGGDEPDEEPSAKQKPTTRKPVKQKPAPKSKPTP